MNNPHGASLNKSAQTAVGAMFFSPWHRVYFSLWWESVTVKVFSLTGDFEAINHVDGQDQKVRNWKTNRISNRWVRKPSNLC